MPKGKQKSKSATTDGKHRRETKEERRERLQHQAEARERCFQLLPYAGGVLLLFLAAFAMWIRSVPPAPIPEKKPLTTTTTTTTTTSQLDLDALKNLDPETLAKAGLTLEDLEKMTATFNTDDDLQQQQPPPPLQQDQDNLEEKTSLVDGDEEISLDEPEAAAEEMPPSEDHQRKDDEL